MKKIIWIDVGTHFAQEHTSIFGSNIRFYLFAFKRFLGGKLLKRGKFVSFRELRVILESRTTIRKKSDNFFRIFIEANPKVARKKNFYPEADILFNLALTDEELRPVSIAKLYIGNGDVLSEGNSLFKEKYPSDEQSYIATLGVASKTFFDELSLYLDKKFGEYIVLLRLNCEGVEDAVIYSVSDSFGKKLKLVCGSLKDVEELKGTEAAKSLDEFMEAKELPFIKFSSGIYTWPEAHAAILKLLDGNNAQ